jgi:hypothetical protein
MQTLNPIPELQTPTVRRAHNEMGPGSSTPLCKDYL